MVTTVRTDGPRGEPRTPPPGDGDRDRSQGRWLRALAALAAGILVVGAVVVLEDDDDDVVAQDGVTTTTVTTSTTTETTATTGTSGTSATVAPQAPSVDRSSAIWPVAGATERFRDAEDAARAFATGYLGFEAPLVGQLLRGDSRSGEVEVRPVADGPVTTLLLRQLTGEDTWSVLGAVTGDIDVSAPQAGEEIRSPVTVRGAALAFEGHVDVEVRQDGNPGPIGQGFVTGGGDVMRPFEATIGFDPPTQRLGAVLFRTRSAEDGRVWQAAAVRVRLGGGETEAVACDGFEVGRPAVGPGEMEVKVYFTCAAAGAGTPLPVYRVVPETSGVLRASLGALLAGPTAEEREAGISSWFSPRTATMLRDVTIADGHAVVDFADLRAVIPNASTSAGSTMLLAQLDATVFQFRSVESVEYRLEGSRDAFFEWLQLDGGEPRTRS